MIFLTQKYFSKLKKKDKANKVNKAELIKKRKMSNPVKNHLDSLIFKTLTIYRNLLHKILLVIILSKTKAPNSSDSMILKT